MFVNVLFFIVFYSVSSNVSASDNHGYRHVNSSHIYGSARNETSKPFTSSKASVHTYASKPFTPNKVCWLNTPVVHTDKNEFQK